MEKTWQQREAELQAAFRRAQGQRIVSISWNENTYHYGGAYLLVLQNGMTFEFYGSNGDETTSVDAEFTAPTEEERKF